MAALYTTTSYSRRKSRRGGLCGMVGEAKRSEGELCIVNDVSLQAAVSKECHSEER